jgi:hypothetical protein
MFEKTYWCKSFQKNKKFDEQMNFTIRGSLERYIVKKDQIVIPSLLILIYGCPMVFIKCLLQS